jgi:hypothetical protein
MTRHTGGGGAPAQWKYCSTPTPVAGIVDPIDVAAGADRVCAITGARTVWCWQGPGGKLEKVAL